MFSRNFGEILDKSIHAKTNAMSIIRNKILNKLYIPFKEKRLWSFCCHRFDKKLGGEHGPAHWRRVAVFGEILSRMDPSVDPMVVRAFACLHDVCRRDNGNDLAHGARAARLVQEIRKTYLSYLNDEQVSALQTACSVHTVARTGDSPTINACLDADRMDLLRCGIMPDGGRMASENGAKIVGKDGFETMWGRVDYAYNRASSMDDVLRFVFMSK